jgi:hypothetical protein
MAEISEMLPGYNCGECGHKQCRDYADSVSRDGDVSKCPYLEQERFADTKAEIVEFLSTHMVVEEKIGKDKVEDIPLQCKGCEESIIGVIDRRRADFSLGPIPGEPSCREDLFPFGRSIDIGPGDVLRYRPLGCPVIHFARVMKYSKGIATVHLAGPRHLLGDKNFQYKDVGICMVTSFEGFIQKGRVPDVGETVKFLPSHCMMQKVHSGVIVHSEGKRLRIEGIDLKVW